MRKRMILILATLGLLLWAMAFTVMAQTDTGQEYVVQAGDTLGTIADQFYGDPGAYPTIIEGTNNKAQEDSSFTAISDPNQIAVGQKLWIPDDVSPTAPSISIEATDEAETETTTADVTLLESYSADGESYGFVDITTGQPAIPAEYEDASDFSEGLAPVLLNDQFGFVDEAGQMVIEPQFDLVGPFSDGYAAYAEIDDQGNALYGYIDSNGDVAVEAQFALVGDFSEGVAAATRGEVDNFEYGYIDPSGVFVIEPQFDFADNFNGGLAGVGIDGKAGFIGPEGAIIIEPQFDFVTPFAEGLALVRSGDLQGYIDQTGAYVIEPTFEYADNFSEGLAVASSADKFGYIDQSGEFAIPPTFDLAGDFSEGLAVVEINGQAGYIGPNGQFVIEPQFVYAEPFEGGYAVAATGNELVFLDADGAVVAQLPLAE